MRLDCPSCAANYGVPDALARPGRRVRRVLCGGEWVAFPEPAAMPASEPGTEPAAPVDDFGFDEEHARAPDPVAPVVAAVVEPLAKESDPPRAPSVALLAARGGSVVAMGAALGGVFVWRDAIAAPPGRRPRACWAAVEARPFANG